MIQNKTLEIMPEIQFKIDHNYRIAIQGFNGMILPQNVAEHIEKSLMNLVESGDLQTFIHSVGIYCWR